MLPLGAIKAPQGKKTLELRQRRPAKGRGREGMQLDPYPDLNLEGMPTLAQSRRGKGTVLTRVGPSPTPREGREPADPFPGLPKVSGFLGKGI